MRVAALLVVVSAVVVSACAPPSATMETGPTNPTDPTDPTAPTNPTNPTDPTNPTTPTDPTIPTAIGCAPLTLEAGKSVGGYLSDVFTWSDGKCRTRTAAMVRNDRADPAGTSGGYLRELTYRLEDGSTRACTGSSNTHPGWGYTVNHFGNTSSSTRDVRGTFTTVFAGRHHALHRYTWQQPIEGRSVKVTIEWLFSTGRSHPLWAISYDASAVPADAIEADTRSPYGDLQWDGGRGVNVDGVGWGDRYRFVTTSAPATFQSAWDYSQQNRVPHAWEWSATADAEMGSVQTQSWEHKDAGGYWFYSKWGQRSSGGANAMPEDWNWTYQLNQYEIPFLLTSKRLAWGANYGAVGKRQYPAYGDDKMLSGWPYQSYSVFAVLGQHTTRAVETQVASVAAYEGVTLSATAGSVATRGPAGVGRTDETAYAPAGYNHVYAAWELEAAADGSAGATFAMTRGPLVNPLIRVRGWPAGATPRITLDGNALTADVDYFASVDDGAHVLWLTLNRTLAATASVAITR